MGRIPLASGSSVPAWPAFWALKARRTRPTAWVEPRSTGLSSTIQPETGSPLRLRPIVGRGTLAALVEIPLNLRIGEQPVHPLGLVEAVVADEFQFRGEL